MVRGGLSTRVSNIFSERGFNMSKSSMSMSIKGSSHSFNVNLKLGNLLNASAIATKSLPSALPWLSLIANLSISLIPVKASLIISSLLDERMSFPTESCRDLRLEISLSGLSNQRFKHLLPMAVLQALILPMRLPSYSPERV